MRVGFVGGGTGGHFYPLIAVAEAIEDICTERRLLQPDMIYIGPPPFDPQALAEHAISHHNLAAGKIRRYGSVLNALDLLKASGGALSAIPSLYSLYPDVIFSTGGYAAFPALAAARILRIPVVIYDADAKPGRVSLWSSKFAQYIAVAHPEATTGFPASVQSKIARTGHPIRKEIFGTLHEGGYEFLHLDATVPTVLFLGGSQGAQKLNGTVLDALSDLVTRYNIVHQTGAGNLEEVRGIASVILKSSPYQARYRPFGLLNTLALRMAAGAASLVVSRAGSGSIFELASWGVPAILVPIPPDISHDQTENAFSYARAGGASVIEQANLSPHVLSAEIDRIMGNSELRKHMSAAGAQFAKPDAARKIAQVLLDICIGHEPQA